MQLAHSRSIFSSFSATVGEEHLLMAGTRAIDDPLRGFAAHVVGMLRCDRRQSRGLLLDGLHDLRVLMADVDVDELTGEVEVAIAVVVPEVAALGSGDGKRP